MINYDSPAFCQAWLDNKLGRKTQHAGFYVQQFDHAEFLCYYGGRQSHPYIIGMRLSRYPEALFLDDVNANSIMEHMVVDAYQAGRSATYTVSFSILQAASKDIAEVETVDVNVVDTTQGPVALILMDINGNKYYTETSTIYCASREEYLSLADIHRASSTIHMKLLKTHLSCSTVKDARENSIPDLVAGDFKVLNESMLAPVPGFKAVIPEAEKQLSRWEPSPIAWDVPHSMLDSDGTLNYHCHRMNKEEFIKNAEDEFRPTETSKILQWKEAHDRWKKAHHYVTQRKLGRNDKGSGNFNAAEVWGGTDGFLYVRGIINAGIDIDVNVGNIWHRVHLR